MGSCYSLQKARDSMSGIELCFGENYVNHATWIHCLKFCFHQYSIICSTIHRTDRQAWIWQLCCSVNAVECSTTHRPCRHARLRFGFITDFGPFEEQYDDFSLREIRRYGLDKGIDIVLGSWSICPSSKTFKADWGTAYDHLVLGIRMAKALGSPAFRVILGNSSDRLTKGA